MDSIDYYEKHSNEYYEATVGLDMSEQLQRFFELLPENAEVLDLGCGSGRDTVWLEEAGCDVTPMDGSPNMCELAGINTDKEVLCLTYGEMDFEEVFDGIWACASLVHIPGEEMDAVLGRITRALYPGGILYISLPLGEGMVRRDGREYYCYTAGTAEELLARQSELEMIDIWTSADARAEQDRQWINILARKNGGENRTDADE